MKKLLLCFVCFFVFSPWSVAGKVKIKNSEILKLPGEYRQIFKEAVEKVVKEILADQKEHRYSSNFIYQGVKIKWLKTIKIGNIEYLALAYALKDKWGWLGDRLFLFARQEKNFSILIDKDSIVEQAGWEFKGFVDLTGDGTPEAVFVNVHDISTFLFIYALKGLKVEPLPVDSSLFGGYEDEPPPFIYNLVNEKGQWKIVVYEEDYNPEKMGFYPYCPKKGIKCYKQIKKGEYYWNGKKFVPHLY